MDKNDRKPKNVTQHVTFATNSEHKTEGKENEAETEESDEGKTATVSDGYRKESDNYQRVKRSPHHRFSSVTPRPNRYGMDPKRNLFPKTKKYRHYPVTCDYCGGRFQPTVLKRHQRKYHFEMTEEPKAGRVKSTPLGRGSGRTTDDSYQPKSAGGMPRQLKICYICGQMYGSRSLKIHEPKCLEKWRIQNEKLPARMRQPEPTKPEPLPEVKGAKDGEYRIPGYDPNAEAAYKSHLKTLIPCCHCSRTFSPDRIEKHESCCIERQRVRQYKTPRGGDIEEK